MSIYLGRKYFLRVVDSRTSVTFSDGVAGRRIDRSSAPVSVRQPSPEPSKQKANTKTHSREQIQNRQRKSLFYCEKSNKELTMVKKKGKSKRTSLQDKYKIEKRTRETARKRKKQGNRDATNGIVKHDKTKKDPGIPNSWPFKQDLLKEIQRTRERSQQIQAETKEKRKEELRALRVHQEGGGTARTIQELVQQANVDQRAFQTKQGDVVTQDEPEKSDGTKAAGQQSRRAYLRELKKVVETADVLLQVLDARDPIGSRIHPSMENVILSQADKRMVLVLNKIDLVPKDMVGSWLTTLRRSHPTIAIKASSDKLFGSTEGGEKATAATTAVGMDCLLQLLKNYARTGATGGKSKTTIVVGVIGYPNVGKSSIINALKRTRAVGVSSRPGFTTCMQEVVLDRNVRLLDSPGVVFNDESAMLGNCIDPDSVEDPIPPITALLKRCNHSTLLMAYNIPSFPPGDAMMFLAMVAKSYGRVLKGGIPDKVGAARAVLRDWNNGKIPYYTAPPKSAAPDVEGDAVVVSHFGKEFDLSKYDQSVMDSLKESDGMDFVQLEGDRESKIGASKEDMDIFTGEAGSDEEEDAEEMDEDSDEEPKSKVAAAEDYDFDAM
jgi:nuclear GTP-binding protein